MFDRCIKKLNTKSQKLTKRIITSSAAKKINGYYLRRLPFDRIPATYSKKCPGS